MSCGEGRDITPDCNCINGKFENSEGSCEDCDLKCNTCITTKNNC